MYDFLKIDEIRQRDGSIEVSPDFKHIRTKDLMVRSEDFYAIWDENTNLWSRDEQLVIDTIDNELWKRKHDLESRGERVSVKLMGNAKSGVLGLWRTYTKKNLRPNAVDLDANIIFANQETKREDFASMRLPYSIEPGPTPAYDELFNTFYEPEQLKKLEWAIGAIITGDSKFIQKFIVITGDRGTGKGTWIKLVHEKLFPGYCAPFEAQALGSAGNQFPLESLRDNPLVGIQEDGKLDRIEDNTRLNSLVSHEIMMVNTKNVKAYPCKFRTFLIVGSNSPVKITDSRSGILRRLIDVKSTGNRIRPTSKYNKLFKQLDFELGAIAYKCRETYLSNKNLYDDYVPVDMLFATNPFFNWLSDRYFQYKEADGVALGVAYEDYKKYCEMANVKAMPRHIFQEELKNYFDEYHIRYQCEDGSRPRNYYRGFRAYKFDGSPDTTTDGVSDEPSWLTFKPQASILDELWADCKAQYDYEVGRNPMVNWEAVTTKLKDIDTSSVHHVKPPGQHIFVDFDLKDETGKKSLELNMEAASKWPQTYAELSKSGSAIHLHYIYQGNTDELNKNYAEGIEIQTCPGAGTCRRKLTRCNNLPVATISSGLPLRKGKKQVLNSKVLRSEEEIANKIQNILATGQPHGHHAPNINYIEDILNKAYNSGVTYDLTYLRADVEAYAMASSNQWRQCCKKVSTMHFKSKEDAAEEAFIEPDDDLPPIVFFDVEVFPNLFLANWKFQGEESVHRLINPTPHDIELLCTYRLIGFNNRRYDNHILWGRMIGLDNYGLYLLSKDIISGKKEALFPNAYSLSYTDVYDFSNKKQSLKKFEIELGIRHKELNLPWDQPVPEELWATVAEYCDNDVIATEAVFNAREEDWIGRQILAELAGTSVNSSTNTCTTRFIFGNNKHPQSEFNYRDLGDCSHAVTIDEYFAAKGEPIPEILFDVDRKYTMFDSITGLPVFPGYTYDIYKRKSEYRGEDPKEGGYVATNPGMHGNVLLSDIASMHPTSVEVENHFGSHTARFSEIKQARIYIKHKEFDKAREMLDGKLAKFLTDESIADNLAFALKIAINSVYGLTAASFENPFKDPRNVDNFIAKRGALFMINLKHEVERHGYTVAHIKTDSIKIPDADPYIEEFVREYGKLYGYNFEFEAVYERMCLVNKAVYIAKYADEDFCKKVYNVVPGDNRKHGGEWTATGTQFQVPYVYKTLFSHEPITKDDYCEVKEVGTSIYLDYNEKLVHNAVAESGVKVYESIFEDLKVGDYIRKKAPNYEFNEEDIHDYHFVGRIGNFIPIKPGYGGALLVRDDGEGPSHSVNGAKGYRWEEAWKVDDMDIIDQTYHQELANEAIEEISKYGSYEWFVSDSPYIIKPNPHLPVFMNLPQTDAEEIPWED